METPFLNPKPLLRELIGNKVLVRLKWAQSFSGILVSIDNYFNVQLTDAHELCGEKDSKIGSVFIRCNNILYIRDMRDEKPENKEESSTKIQNSKDNEKLDEDEKIKETNENMDVEDNS